MAIEYDIFIIFLVHICFYIYNQNYIPSFVLCECENTVKLI